MNDLKNKNGRPRATLDEYKRVCITLCSRINVKRVLDEERNIRYENKFKVWEYLENADYETHWKEYRRLYKKAQRNNVKTDGLWDRGE